MSNNHKELKICGSCWDARHEDLDFHRCEQAPILSDLLQCHCPCKDED